MALVTFVDDSAPYLNAQNLNNNFNACYERAYIMVFIQANKTIAIGTAWDPYTIPFDKVKYNVGNKFSLNTTTGEITYTGDKALKITLHIKRDTSTTAGRIYPTTSDDNYFQDDTTDALPLGSHISIRPKGSTIAIYGRVRTSATGNAVLNGNSTSPYTYMIVEEM